MPQPTAFQSSFRGTPLRSNALRALLLLGCLLGAVHSLGGQESSAWEFRFGPLWHSPGRLSFSGGSRSGSEFESGTSREIPQMEDATGYGDRRFEDGYVLRDSGTGLSDIRKDSTWNWGYQHASQYDARTQTLSFHCIRETICGETLRNASSSSFSPDAHIEQRGCTFILNRNIAQKENFILSISGGVDLFWDSGHTFHGSDFSTEGKFAQYAVTVEDTYRYDAGEIADFPAAGHSGTYDGPFSDPPTIPSPLLPNIPQGVSTRLLEEGEAVSRQNFTERNQIRLHSRHRGQTLWIGPQLHYAIAPHLQLECSPRLGITHTRWEASRRETLRRHYDDGNATDIRSWRDRRAVSRLRPSLVLTAGILWTPLPSLRVHASIGAEILQDRETLRLGPGKLAFRPGQLQAGLQISYAL